MNGKILFSLRAFIPRWAPLPREEIEEWATAYGASRPKAQKALLKAVANRRAFRKKIARPLLDVTGKMLRPDFVSRKDLTRAEILRGMKSKLGRKDAAKQYRRAIKDSTRKVPDELPLIKWRRARGLVFGPAKGHPAIELVENWLTGNPASRALLRKEDRLISGEPVNISRPEVTGIFKSKLHNQFLRALKNICDLNYDPPFIKRQNDKISQLVNEYLRTDLVPLETGGASHLDFVLIPESITPADARVVREMEYQIYASFLGKERADDLRARWIEKDYPTPPDPAEYLGQPGQKAYFDMYLDIQVSKR